MISQKQETISFNIVNFPLSKELLLGVGAKSNFICDKLNIPLLSQKQQVDKSQRANFKLFTDVNQSYRMLGKHHHTQRLKIQTSLCVNDQMENKEIWRDKDMSTKRRLSQQNQAQRISLEGSTSKSRMSLKTECPIYLLIKVINKTFKLRKIANMRTEELNHSLLLKSDHIIIPRIKLFNNTLIVRNEKLKYLKLNLQQTRNYQQIKYTKNISQKVETQDHCPISNCYLQVKQKYRLVLFKRNQEMQHFRKLKMPHLKFLQFLDRDRLNNNFKILRKTYFLKLLVY